MPADLAGLAERVRAQVPAGPLRWITVQQGRELQLITVDEICYLRAEHKYVSVVTAETEALISTPLKDMLALLDPSTFWQVHRSIVVNINAVRSINRALSGNLTLHLKGREETLPVSAGHAHLFKQW
ncbi:MAG: LytTR family DNA-binding domain-containing protein [Pseudomonadota bacterium]